MGLLVRLDDWVLRRRAESAYFDWEWELEGMDEEIKKQPVQLVAVREIGDICNIFRDVTGLAADPHKEKTVILFWMQRGLSLHDFRLLIEFQFNDPRQKDFYAKAGNLNLRMMLNPASADRLSDILDQLRHAKRIKESKAEFAPRSSPMMLMRCGKKIAVGDKASYDAHMNECFNAKGACFL